MFKFLLQSRNVFLFTLDLLYCLRNEILITLLLQIVVVELGNLLHQWICHPLQVVSLYRFNRFVICLNLLKGLLEHGPKKELSVAEFANSASFSFTRVIGL
jgi:hypothetical protein